MFGKHGNSMTNTVVKLEIRSAIFNGQCISATNEFISHEIILVRKEMTSIRNNVYTVSTYGRSLQ